MMQSSKVGLISRSSSAALLITQPPTIFDDMSIAAGLLTEPKDPRHRSSFTGISFVGLDGSDNAQQRSDSQADGVPEGRSRRAMRTSNTWTSSSGDVLSDQDDVDDRTVFVQEYNRLARKHGVREVDPEEYDGFNDDVINLSTKQGSWFSRKILRKTSSSQSVKLKPERHVKHRRSISDLSLRLKAKRDKLKDKDIQELVRLCGSSLLYLPTEYAAGSLALPTCFRATAQYLVQHAPSTRGVFRVPGSQNIVAALYNHYGSMDEDGQVVSGTVRCPTLPDHIRCDVHDVASAFKKFLSGLPGGILGSLNLFSVLISIQTQLRGDPELTRTKQSKVRARLIALSIATLRSQYRRELICAVFGLLSMIGRAAEIAPREDDRGRPLPTADLMGYGPLGIVFGPLLVGDLLGDYTMRIANPQGGLVLLPISPPKSRKEKHKKSRTGDEGIAFNTQVDKIKIANSITEMLITHWRDVVRHMRSLSALKIVATTKSVAIRGPRQPMLRPSASESFALRKPPDWDQFKSPMRRLERSVSPTPTRRIHNHIDTEAEISSSYHGDMLVVKKQRSKSKPLSSHRLSGGRSLSILSPTAEEKWKEEQQESPIKAFITTEDQITAIASACPNPPCTSGSLRLTSSPLKDGIYSPSTSSDDGTFPLNMIPLPNHREEPMTSVALYKENKNPRPIALTSNQAESPKEDDRFGHDSKQQLHFMSTPTFTNSSPSKGSRKKGRNIKGSSSSTGRAKSARSSGAHAKLQKQSPGSVEGAKSRHQKVLKQEEEFHMVGSTEVRDYDAELKEFVADWTALDIKRKLLQAGKGTYNSQSSKTVLDGEQADLEARYESIQADKAASERYLAVLEARHEAITAAHAAVENENSTTGSAQTSVETSPQNHTEPQETTSGKIDEAIAGNDQYSSADIDTLEDALNASDKERKDLQMERIQLLWDEKALLAKCEARPAELAPGEEDATHKREWAELQDRKQNLNSRDQAAKVTLQTIVTRLTTLDDSRQIQPDSSTAAVAGDMTSLSSSSRERYDSDEQPKDPPPAEPDQMQPTIKASGPGHLKQDAHDHWPSNDTTRTPETLRSDLGAFKASVEVWKDKWKTYDQGKKTMSISEKKSYDEEKQMLIGRWHTLKVRLDGQKKIDGTEEEPKLSLLLLQDIVPTKSESGQSVSTASRPEITISRASTHTPEDQSRSTRRIGGSEPGLQPRGCSHSPRRISRSLYEDPKRKKNLIDLSRTSRDPLSRISREEDDASLIVLAQALDVYAEDDLLEKMSKPIGVEMSSNAHRAPQTTRPVLNVETSTNIKKLGGSENSNDIGSKNGLSTEAISQMTAPEVSMLEGAADTALIQQDGAVPFESRQDSATSCFEMYSPHSESEKRRIEVAIPVQRMQVPVEKSASQLRRSTVPMMSNHEQGSGPNTTSSTGSPSKISALVAKFNRSSQVTEFTPPKASPTKLLAKTPRRATDAQADIATPKDSIVSPYTTNAASPTRSQRSEKTPQSARTALGGKGGSLLDPKSSPVRKPTPKRVLRDSLHDSTPLRPVVRGAKSPQSITSQSKLSNPYAVSLRSVHKNTDGSPTRLYSIASSDALRNACKFDGAAISEQKGAESQELASTTMMPPPHFSITPLLQSDIHVKGSSTSSSRTAQPAPQSAGGLAGTADKVDSELDNIQLKPASMPRSQEDVFDEPIFDGPGGPFHIGRVLPHPDPLPVAHHLNLARPPTIFDAEAEVTGLTNPQVTYPPPGRSSSILYNQVRNLQRQLSERVDEIHHLRQQLSARGDLEIGTLCEELRETKRDLQIWKSRAEVAEKQLEILNKMPSRSNSLKNTTVMSSTGANCHQRSSIDSRKEEGTMADRIRKALHGMDGAESPRRWDSEESTDTVIRDLKDLVTGSDYSVWAEQTMNAIDSTDNGDRIR